MITMNWDVANNIASFVQITMALIGGLFIAVVSTTIAWAGVKMRLSRAEVSIFELESALEKTQFNFAAENVKLEGKIDSFQLTLNSVASGISEIKGFIKGKYNHIRNGE